MFVTIHLVGEGREGGTTGEFPEKVAQQVNSHNQATTKQLQVLKILMINRVPTM